MKSNALKHFLKRTSEINNHLSHILFISEQFYLDNTSNIQNDPNRLTSESDFFKSNEYCELHNVESSQLLKQKDASVSFLKYNFFIAINTQFEVYLKELYLFIKINFIPSLIELNKFSVYDNFLDHLDIRNNLEDLNTSTYEYFVLRRNAIIHRDREKLYQGELAKKIKADGGKLTTLWQQRKLEKFDLNIKTYNINDFDFSNTHLTEFSTNEIIDLLNFYRLFAIEINDIVLKKLDKNSIESFLYESFKKTYEAEEIENKFGKLNHFANIELGYSFDRKAFDRLSGK